MEWFLRAKYPSLTELKWILWLGSISLLMFLFIHFFSNLWGSIVFRNFKCTFLRIIFGIFYNFKLWLVQILYTESNLCIKCSDWNICIVFIYICVIFFYHMAHWCEKKRECMRDTEVHIWAKHKYTSEKNSFCYWMGALDEVLLIFGNRLGFLD